MENYFENLDHTLGSVSHQAAGTGQGDSGTEGWTTVWWMLDSSANLCIYENISITLTIGMCLEKKCQKQETFEHTAVNLTNSPLQDKIH